MTIAEDLVIAYEPWITPDATDYLIVIGGMFAETEELIQLTEEGDLLGPDDTPERALPYLAQYVGERLPLGIGEVAAREWIKDAPNQRRGTLSSIFYAAQRTLTGTRTVSILERDGTNAKDRLSVYTYTAETPDTARVLRDLEDVVPADIVLTYAAITGETWSAMLAAHALWSNVLADFATWGDVAAALAGSSSFSRPPP